LRILELLLENSFQFDKELELKEISKKQHQNNFTAGNKRFGNMAGRSNNNEHLSSTLLRFGQKEFYFAFVI
jgi:hypothetical protein